jgi:hypothetical protein
MNCPQCGSPLERLDYPITFTLWSSVPVDPEIIEAWLKARTPQVRAPICWRCVTASARPWPEQQQDRTP